MSVCVVHNVQLHTLTLSVFVNTTKMFWEFVYSRCDVRIFACYKNLLTHFFKYEVI